MSETVLVTGAAGFLGSHLCERLLRDGNYVLAVDNFYSSNPKNIKHLRNDPSFELLRHDVCFPLYLECDFVFNLACPASPVFYQLDPVQTVKTCVLGTINGLGMAKRLGIPFFQASTSEIYGDPLEHPQPEEYWGNVNPVGTRSCYDEGKRCAETLVMDYHRQHKLNTRIVRIFNTYGPKMAVNDGRVVSNFICQALRDEPITIYGDGSQTRSFCYVDDLIEGFMLVKKKGNAGSIFNLGNDAEISVSVLAKIIIDLVGSSSSIEYRDLPTDDPSVRKPELSRAKKVLNWSARISLEDGLIETIDYFKRSLKF